jgi:hypothetical protein
MRLHYENLFKTNAIHENISGVWGVSPTRISLYSKQSLCTSISLYAFLLSRTSAEKQLWCKISDTRLVLSGKGKNCCHIMNKLPTGIRAWLPRNPSMCR